jgi:predicted 3-demethylubiquinone-9 3-methyltransferase (glyoxalase superfamily)
MGISHLTTYLWFDNEAQEAAEFYVSVFPNSRIVSMDYYKEHHIKPAGSVLSVQFELMGQSFATLNGGPQFPHSEAVSFQVFGDSQEDIDYLWNALTANGGQESQCGWCKDKYGVSWQIIPRVLSERLNSDDQEIADRTWKALMNMTKIVIADL